MAVAINRMYDLLNASIQVLTIGTSSMLMWHAFAPNRMDVQSQTTLEEVTIAYPDYLVKRSTIPDFQEVLEKSEGINLSSMSLELLIYKSVMKDWHRHPERSEGSRCNTQQNQCVKFFIIDTISLETKPRDDVFTGSLASLRMTDCVASLPLCQNFSVVGARNDVNRSPIKCDKTCEVTRYLVHQGIGYFQTSDLVKQNGTCPCAGEKIQNPENIVSANFGALFSTGYNDHDGNLGGRVALDHFFNSGFMEQLSEMRNLMRLNLNHFDFTKQGMAEFNAASWEQFIDSMKQLSSQNLCELHMKWTHLNSSSLRDRTEMSELIHTILENTDRDIRIFGARLDRLAPEILENERVRIMSLNMPISEDRSYFDLFI